MSLELILPNTYNFQIHANCDVAKYLKITISCTFSQKNYKCKVTEP